MTAPRAPENGEGSCNGENHDDESGKDESGDEHRGSFRGARENADDSIVADLTDAGYLVKEKDGRRNRCHVQAEMPLPDRTSARPTIGEVVALLTGLGGGANSMDRGAL